jgi:hypothetical protein
MRFDLSDDEFKRSAISWLRSLDNDDVASWSTVMRRSPGYYPTTLLPVWRQELERRQLSPALEPVAGDAFVSLPHSHPADYDWRFTQATTTLLVDWLLQEGGPGSLIAHIGTPSTFVEGIVRARSSQHVLLERNPAMIGALDSAEHKIVQIDLLAEEPPHLGAHAAVADPPWYLPDTEAFLRAAHLSCRPGALVLVCQPSVATRPGVADERAQLIDKLSLYGFDLCKIHENAARYTMPHFEAMSLRMTAGNVSIPHDWRTGDILELRREGLLAVGADDVLAPIERWSEARFGPVRIKLRVTAEWDLGHIVPNDVLDSVSRRDPVRAKIGFWTSGNRVLTLKNPDTIGKLIEFCHADYMYSRFSLDSMTAKAHELGLSASLARQLFDVLLVELQEHDAYWRRAQGD